MDIEGVKRSLFWMSFFIFLIILAFSLTAERLMLPLRVILVCLLALLASMFRLREPYSMLSFILTIAASLSTGAVLANNSVQFWILSLIFFVAFFFGCELFERNWLGV